MDCKYLSRNFPQVILIISFKHVDFQRQGDLQQTSDQHMCPSVPGEEGEAHVEVHLRVSETFHVR